MAFLTKGLNMARMKKKLKLFAVVFTLTAAAAGGFFAVSNKHPANKTNQGMLAYQAGDYQTAFEIFSAQNAVENPEAPFIVGAMYFAGQGVEQNEEKAFFYYEQAADFGYIPAQTTLAMLYAHKHRWDDAYAFARKAAENGDIEAQMLLAGWYENGAGRPFDMQKAVHFYELAAKNGDLNAKTALYLIYKEGKRGFPANEFAAGRWLRVLQKQKALIKKLQ